MDSKDSNPAISKLIEGLTENLELQKQQTKLLRELQESLSGVERRVEGLRRTEEIVRQTVSRPLLDEVWEFLDVHQLSLKATLERLALSKNSFARFRENEIRLVTDPVEVTGKNEHSKTLSRSLRSILSTPKEGLLVGLPQFNRDLFWARIWSEHWGRLRPLAYRNGVLGNSHVTRPIVFQFLGDEAVSLWKRVWQDKHVLVVTGDKGGYDAASNLLASARSVEQLQAPKHSAYKTLPQIRREVQALDPQVTLVSLGPSAPCLVEELHARGLRAIDIGSLGHSYASAFR